MQLIAVFIYMVFIDWQLSLMTLILAPIVSILVSQFGAKVMISAERSQKQVSNLKADLQNCQIIIAHHANYIKENVPASAEIDEPKAETPKVEEAPKE